MCKTDTHPHFAGRRHQVVKDSKRLMEFVEERINNKITPGTALGKERGRVFNAFNNMLAHAGVLHSAACESRSGQRSLFTLRGFEINLNKIFSAQKQFVLLSAVGTTRPFLKQNHKATKNIMGVDSLLN